MSYVFYFIFETGVIWKKNKNWVILEKKLKKMGYLDKNSPFIL